MVLQTKDLLLSRTDDLIVDALEISQRTTNLVSRSFDLLLYCLVTQLDLLDPLPRVETTRELRSNGSADRITSTSRTSDHRNH
jgi:hypothetical protein